MLVAPTHPGNIGGVARAMKTMGLGRLILVAPEAEFPSQEATRRAAGAEDVLARTETYDTLDAALSDCRLVVGTTARPRSIDWPQMSPRQAALRMIVDSASGPVALLFGQERSGLSNPDVDRCHYLVRIPTHPDFASLNLASAAQIMAYELFLACYREQVDSVEKPSMSVDWKQMRSFYDHLERVLLNLDFPNARPPTKLMRKLMRLFNKARPNEEEMQILRGILSAVEQNVTNKIS